MALNKPKYSLFKNGRYAVEGLIEVVKHESSFKLQVLLFVAMSVVAWVLPVEFIYKLILQGSLFVPIMSELTNSAVERTVDLVTKEYHLLAKRAKDAGAALVLVSLIMTGFVWAAVLAVAFELI